MWGSRLQEFLGVVYESVINEHARESRDHGGIGCRAAAQQRSQGRYFVRLFQGEVVGSQDRQSRGGTQICWDSVNGFDRPRELVGFLIEGPQGKRCLCVPRLQFKRLLVRGFGIVTPPLQGIELPEATICRYTIGLDGQNALEEGFRLWIPLLPRPDRSERVNSGHILRLAGDNFPKLFFRIVDLPAVN